MRKRDAHAPLLHPQDQAPPLAGRPAARWVCPFIVAAGVLLAAGVIAHRPDILNGPYYWKWEWARIYPRPLYVGFALAALPLFIGLILHERGHVGAVPLLALATITAFAARIIWMIIHSPSHDLSYLSHAIRHPNFTSYYTDATGLANFPGWLPHYHDVTQVLSSHSRNKPPGPILFYYAFIQTFGDSARTANIAGLTLAVLQAIAVPAAWFLLRVLSRSAAASVYGACFLALCPGYTLVFPSMDPLYIVLTSLLLAAWALALERDRLLFSLAAGALLALTTLMTFNFMVIGVFFVGYALCGTGRRFLPAVIIALKHAAVALMTGVGCYLLLFLLSGYNPVATFFMALKNQRFLLSLPTVVRPYPRTILFDLMDFSLGAAWIGAILAFFWAATALSAAPRERVTRIVILCFVQLLIVAISGLLPGETARVWNFLLPLLLLPIGLELARLRGWERIAVFAAEWLLLAAIAQNMQFLF